MDKIEEITEIMIEELRELAGAAISWMSIEDGKIPINSEEIVMPVMM